jgi:hypothetical protein
MKYRLIQRLMICAALNVLFLSSMQAQEIPSRLENIQYLVTFGTDADAKWGDDDHVQTIFFLVPKEITAPFYIRIFDPDTGGEADQENGSFNSTTSFAVYGGKGAYSDKDARSIHPKGNYRSGILIDEKTFGVEAQYDQKWYTFGPFSPTQGEYVQVLGARIFKVIAEGKTGDDGNLYKYFLSSNAERNVPLDGGNAFTYEYSFRLFTEEDTKAHLYPFIDQSVKSIKQYNFDFDGDGTIKIYSVAKNGHQASGSLDRLWASSEHHVVAAERGKSYDIQIRKPTKKTFNNDMVMYVLNEYDQPVPFFATPIGGPPKYNYVVKVQTYHDN